MVFEEGCDSVMVIHSLQAITLAALEMATYFMKRCVRMSITIFVGTTRYIEYDQAKNDHVQLSQKHADFCDLPRKPYTPL